MNALIGEAMDNEAVIPLNAGGVDVIAEALAKYTAQFEAKMNRAKFETS